MVDPSFSASSRSSPSRFFELSSSTTPRRSFLESIMEQMVDFAAYMIMKWNLDTSDHAVVTSLFYENKRDALQFLECVHDLQKIHAFVSR